LKPMSHTDLAPAPAKPAPIEKIALERYVAPA
jgi:hypothetical protein